MTRVNRWMGVIAATVGAAVLTFWLQLRYLRPGWESTEYAAIAVWTLPLAGLILLLARPLRPRLRGRPARRAVVGALVALASAVTWTVLAVALTGGYALAFDANPLLCWTAASVMGTAVALSWPDRRGTHARGGQPAA